MKQPLVAELVDRRGATGGDGARGHISFAFNSFWGHMIWDGQHWLMRLLHSDLWRPPTAWLLFGVHLSRLVAHKTKLKLKAVAMTLYRNKTTQNSHLSNILIGHILCNDIFFCKHHYMNDVNEFRGNQLMNKKYTKVLSWKHLWHQCFLWGK